MVTIPGAHKPGRINRGTAVPRLSSPTGFKPVAGYLRGFEVVIVDWSSSDEMRCGMSQYRR